MKQQADEFQRLKEATIKMIRQIAESREGESFAEVMQQFGLGDEVQKRSSKPPSRRQTC